ncbi:MAG: hypothetical protein AB8F95_03110 [Bacteroidia bacterium]
MKLLDFVTAHPETDLQDIFAHVYPNQTYDARRIHSLLGALYKQLLRFLAWQEMNESPEQESIFALQALRKMNAESAFESEARRLTKHLEKQTLKDPAFHFNAYQVAIEEDTYLTQRQVRKPNQAFQKQMDALDHFYFGAKFVLSAEALSRNAIIGGAYQTPFTETMCEWYDQAGDEHIKGPWVKIQRQLLRCLQEPDQAEHYESFIALLEVHKELLPLDSLRYLYKSAQNYCIRRINSGDARFQKALFELFQTMLDQDLLLNEQQQISHSDVKNIVTVALRQKAFDWTDAFIKNYSQRVHTKHRENVTAYCQALYDANTGNNQQAIRRLREVSFTDVLYDLSARRLLAQIYYEQEDWEALNHHYNAFDLFLRRQKQLSTHNRKSHLNFVRILKALAKWEERRHFQNAEKNEKQKITIRDRIESTEPLAYREWLRELV